jgi:hypothetical protein
MNDAPPVKKPASGKRKFSKVESEDEDENMSDAPTTKKPKMETAKKVVTKDAFKKSPSDDEKEEIIKNDSSESEMSVVIDEAPKPKRKSKPKSSEPKASKSSKPAKASKPAKTSELSPNEETIKTLQSQLKKCGINKIWQFELKKYGDDTKAKIKHLQSALKEAGMVGRFSEARAREIKEMRELMADVEAVKEGEKSWGLESGRRSRSLVKKEAKKLKEEESEDDEDDDKDAEKKTRSRSQSDEPVIKRDRVRADLAFLGSDDSDE